MLRPTPSTVKTLFALSGNRCSYRGCEEVLTDPTWGAVNCDIAHIAGEAPRAPRFDPAMSDSDRRSFDNLMLLCPTCHRRVDSLQPEEHPVDLLREMKRQHEERVEPIGAWTDEVEVDRLVQLTLAAFAVSDGRRRADFGAQVKQAREDRGLSHHALGKLAGMSGRTVRDIEMGQSNTLASTYDKLSQALDLGA